MTVTADEQQLAEAKQAVIKALRPTLKVAGFRAGKVPAELVEKHADPAAFQTQFIDEALNRIYSQALAKEGIRPAAAPDVSVTKFVPFTTLEADFEVAVVGEIKLPDYKKFRLARTAVKVETKDVDEVLSQLRTRSAKKQPVDRAAKDGDEVVIDFVGRDAKTKKPIDGGSGKEYALVIGSGSFIPGFEPELIGLKPGGDKTFDITFPKDYGAAELQSLKAEFTVTVLKVNELVLPKLDDDFAKTVGPFPGLADLKADIKKQLQTERSAQADRDYESEVLEQLAAKTKVEIPDALIDQEIQRIESDERQNLVYRGQTWEEHLKQEGTNEEEHREKQRPGAVMRVRAGLVLAEIADREDIRVSEPELEEQLASYHKQYADAGMLQELDKPESRREIASRLMTQKTIKFLTDLASKSGK